MTRGEGKVELREFFNDSDNHTYHSVMLALALCILEKQGAQVEPTDHFSVLPHPRHAPIALITS